MRIALISTPFVAVPPRGYGGTELVIHELTEGLTARGHDVTLFATGDSHTSATLRALYATPQWPPDPIPDLNHVSWACQAAREEGCDIIHAHSAAALACGRFAPDIPLVYTIHHARQDSLSAYYTYFPDVQYVAISHDQASRETPLDGLTVIHHGLDPARYEWTETAADYACFIGRLSPVKGPATAIHVAHAANVPIRVAGDVHKADAAYAAHDVEPLLSLPHVTYLGGIGMARKRSLLRDARVLLAPLAWHEPFGLVMIEAMLSGCPVLAFPMGSATELIEPGVTGFLPRDRADMVALLRADGPLDTFDRARCRARAVERFSSERMVAGYERVYERAYERAGRRIDDRPWTPAATHAVTDDMP